jgi:hypothetical protein
VLADGKVVGRILEEGSRFGPPELRWFWPRSAAGVGPHTDPDYRKSGCPKNDTRGVLMCEVAFLLSGC